MAGCNGFEVTEDDVAIVLMRGGSAAGWQAAMERAQTIMESIDCEEVSEVALGASTDLDEQTAAAHDEIDRQLRKVGLIA